MKDYFVYDIQTDEFLLKVRAWSIVDAEIKACVLLKKGSNDVAAFTEPQ